MSKKKLSPEQAYSLIKTMIKRGATLVVNDITSQWEIMHENTNDEYLYFEDLFEGYNLQIFRNDGEHEEVRKEINNVSIITKATVKDNCLKLSVTNGDSEMYIDFFPPKIVIDEVLSDMANAGLF